MIDVAQFIALHESDLTFADRTDRVREEILELLGGEAEDRWIWIRDITDSWVVYEDSGAGSPTPGLFRVGYTIDDAGSVDIQGPAVEVQAVTTYTPEPGEPTPDVPLLIQPDESATELLGDCIPLVESVVRRDGTVPIKIIKEGWGTTGYYGADVIKDTGPTAFTAGTQMYWDHPTLTEQSDRPERSLRDLAAVLESDAYWLDSGPKGPGLYGDAKLFSDYQAPIEDLAPHIGVSIRALGRAHLGEAEGRHGTIVDEIVSAKSIDFVTAAGAGGEVLSLFESARDRGRTRKEPVVGDQELREANTKLTEATALGTLAAAERDTLKIDVARLREGQLLREASDHVATLLDDGPAKSLPDVTRSRILREAASNPPMKDGALDKDALKTRFDATVKENVEYLQSVGVGTGRVAGLGGLPVDADEAATTAAKSKLKTAFIGLGLSESGADIAVAGRPR